MMKFFVSAVLCLISFTFASGQSTFLPRNLGLAVNSTYDEVHPLISPDGKTLFFTRKNHPQNVGGAKRTSSIWVSMLQQNGNWSTAILATSLNRWKNNQVLSMTNDGLQMLTFNEDGLAISKKESDVWTLPQQINIKGTEDAALTGDGKQIIFSKSGKLYHSELNDDKTWTTPVAVKNLAAGKIVSPTLLDDGTLYFSVSKKGKGLELAKTKRIGTGWDQWSPVEFLNDTINTIGNETGLHTTPNGAWGYYSSVTTTGRSDIFIVKIYEDRPFVLVSGKILNTVSKKSVRKKDAKILLDGVLAEHFTIDKDSGTFEVKVPFGKQYAVVAAIDHYQPVSFTVDTRGHREFSTATLNLEEIPKPYVVLKGKLLIKNMDKAIPQQANPKIVVDGIEIDSATINANGEYEVKLNHGTYYYVQVVAKRFESFPAMIDLKEIDGYEEIVIDLQADAEKMAIVTGVVRSRKSGQPLSSDIPKHVEVEGVASVAAVIDSLTGNYEVRLPLKEKHVIRVVADGHYPVNEVIDVTKETSEVTITRDLVAVPLERGQSVRFNTLDVAAKIDQAKPYPELDSLAAFMQRNPAMKIEVGAHVETGAKLPTLKPAQEVASYLVSKGVSRSRISARGHGSTKPVVSNKVPDAKTLNRRIEFTLLDF